MSSTAISAEGSHSQPIDKQSSKYKTLGIAIAIIVGIGGFVVAGVGLGELGVQQGWWKIGTLSNLSQIQAIVMMGMGGGGGIIFLIIGIVSSIQHQKSSREISQTTVQSSNESMAEEIKRKKMYGPEEYQIWGIEMVGEVEEVPEFLLQSFTDRADEKDGLEESYPLLYIPKKIRFKGEEIDLTVESFLKIIQEGGNARSLYQYLSNEEKEALNAPTNPGWRRVRIEVMPDSKGKYWGDVLDMFDDGRSYEGCFPPDALEVIILMHMVRTHTGEVIYGDENKTYCSNGFYEALGGYNSICVGWYPGGLLNIQHVRQDVLSDNIGTGIVMRQEGTA